MSKSSDDTSNSKGTIYHDHDKVVATNIALIAATIAQGSPGDEDIKDAYMAYKKILGMLKTEAK